MASFLMTSLLKDFDGAAYMPRFVRLGDEAMVSARLFNQSEKDISAKAKVEILDPATEKVLFTDSKAIVLKAQGSGSATL